MEPMRTSRLVHRWLRIAGTITWSVIGITFVTFFLDAPAIGAARWIAWTVAFVAFLALFWIDTRPDAELASRRARVASLVLQSCCALAIAWLPSKPVGFIFLTLVAAQMPGVLSLWGAAAWIVIQSAAMGAIYAQIVPAWEAQAYIAVYLGFQAFAYIVVRAALGRAAGARRSGAHARRVAREGSALGRDSASPSARASGRTCTTCSATIWRR